MNWLTRLRYLGYLAYVQELITLVTTPRPRSEIDAFVGALATLAYKVVDTATLGLASRSIPQGDLIDALRALVDVFEPILPWSD